MIRQHQVNDNLWKRSTNVINDGGKLTSQNSSAHLCAQNIVCNFVASRKFWGQSCRNITSYTSPDLFRAFTGRRQDICHFLCNARQRTSHLLNYDKGATNCSSVLLPTTLVQQFLCLWHLPTSSIVLHYVGETASVTLMSASICTV